ncbi:hypothetical protein [Actinomadura opuntiae]|uniref:hypothetical protein n=1 Tax=Actinomadura sp. OS1-43 TaxID=604315 RepID=UPI00255A75C3|nr:hypothetical protein [Actinomadura sp. OS1-43]MDL4813119.1 hypothetical protein [Actinomadura sp. OS1-43]
MAAGPSASAAAPRHLVHPARWMVSEAVRGEDRGDHADHHRRDRVAPRFLVEELVHRVEDLDLVAVAAQPEAAVPEALRVPRLLPGLQALEPGHVQRRPDGRGQFLARGGVEAHGDHRSQPARFAVGRG